MIFTQFHTIRNKKKILPSYRYLAQPSAIIVCAQSVLYTYPRDKLVSIGAISYFGPDRQGERLCYTNTHRVLKVTPFFF